MIQQVAPPANPGVGKALLFTQNDKLYMNNSLGNTIQIGYDYLLPVADVLLNTSGTGTKTMVSTLQAIIDKYSSIHFRITSNIHTYALTLDTNVILLGSSYGFGSFGNREVTFGFNGTTSSDISLSATDLTINNCTVFGTRQKV